MNKIIVVSESLECDVEKAFGMFTQNGRLESWLTTVAEVENFVGGKYELFWNPQDRENDSTIGCRVTGFEPNRFVSFEWRSPQQFKHFANNADPLTHVVVFFIPTKEGCSVNLVHSGWRSSPEWEEARIWQERAWEFAFGELTRIGNGF